MAALQVRQATQSAVCRQPQPGSQSHTNHWHGILREILCNIYIINVVALQDYQRELESSTCAQPCGPALPFSDHRHHYITAAISSLLSSHDTPHTSNLTVFWLLFYDPLSYVIVKKESRRQCHAEDLTKYISSPFLTPDNFPEFRNSTYVVDPITLRTV